MQKTELYSETWYLGDVGFRRHRISTYDGSRGPRTPFVAFSLGLEKTPIIFTFGFLVDAGATNGRVGARGGRVEEYHKIFPLSTGFRRSRREDPQKLIRIASK